MIVETKNGHKVELREELTARAHAKLESYLSRHMKLKALPSQETGKPEVAPELSGEAIADLQEETVKAFVLKFNDEEKLSYDRMMDTLVASEYDQVLEAIDELRKEMGKGSASS